MKILHLKAKQVYSFSYFHIKFLHLLPLFIRLTFELFKLLFIAFISKSILIYYSVFLILSVHNSQLTDHRIDRGVVILGRVAVFFQQALDHFAHGGAGRNLLLPVDGAVFAQHLGQLPGQVDQLVVLVEVLDVLGLGEGVVKGQLLLGETQLFAVVVLLGDLLAVFSSSWMTSSLVMRPL